MKSAASPAGRRAFMSALGNILVRSRGRSSRRTRRRRRRPWFVELPPRNILADTGPLFALIHAGDADHARAVEFARSFTGRLITTWPVLPLGQIQSARYWRSARHDPGWSLVGLRPGC